MEAAVCNDVHIALRINASHRSCSNNGLAQYEILGSKAKSSYKGNQEEHLGSEEFLDWKWFLSWFGDWDIESGGKFDIRFAEHEVLDIFFNIKW